MTEEAPNPVDVHVGRRVRLRRSELGVSQGWLADRLGLTFQQVQKYKRGSNRISASKLYQIASVLEVPITFFSRAWMIRPRRRAHGTPMRSRASLKSCWPSRMVRNWPNPF